MEADKTVHVLVVAYNARVGEDFIRATCQRSARVYRDWNDLQGVCDTEVQLVGAYWDRWDWPEILSKLQFMRERGDIVRMIEVRDFSYQFEHLMEFGYAPGHYMSRCIECGRVKLDMDKRAIRCRPCAEILSDNEVWHDQ